MPRHRARAQPFTSHTQVLENPAAADEPQPPRKAPVAASVEPPKAPQPQQTALAAAAWQAVLFRGNKPVGKLVTPTVEWQPLEASPAGQEEVEREQAAVGRIALHFASIVPAAGDASGDDASSGRGRSSSEPQPLCLPVDDDFAQHSYRVQVIARQGGANFAVLHAFRAEGRELTAALSVQQQWQEYQQRHQAARASAGQPTSTTNFAHSSTLAVRSGDGLERLQAIFDVAARPAWLKGLVFRFLVTETEQPETRAPVDGSSGSTATGAKGGPAAVTIAGDDMAAPERRARQEAGTLAAPKQHHLQEQQRQQQQPEAAVAPAAAQPADAGSPAAPPAGRAATSVQPAAAAPAAPAGKGGKSKGRKKAPQRAQDAAAAATAADAPSSRAASRASSSSSSAPSAAGSSAPSTAASRGKPAAAMVPQASQGAALVEAADAGVGAARKEQRSARPGRSRSSSRDRHSRAGQEAAAARRLAKQSPTPTAQQEVPAAASMLASVPERCEPSSKADAAGSITPSGTPRGAQRSSKAEQCQQPAAAPSSSSKVAKAATPVVGGAKAAAAASTPEVAAAAGGAHSSSQAAKAAAAAAAPPSQCPTETDARQPPAAEHGSSSKWLPLGEETSLSVAAGHATAVWHGAADSAECAAALCTPRPGQPGSRPQSPGDCSVCSDGSTLSSQDSWRSGVPENPSEYGLPYNFGHHPLMLFHWQDHAALPLAAPHSVPASPHRAAAEGPARCARRGGATGLALGPSRNLPPMAGAVSGFYPPPPQPQPPRAAPAYGHHRTGSTSSSGSDGAGPAPAFHPAVQQQWQGSHLSGWAEPFVPGQPFVLPHGHPPPHPPQFVPRSQPGARAQWGRQRQAADGDPCWRPHRRSSSGWLEGGPQRQQAFDGAPPPPPPSGPPPAQCFPSPPCVACGVGPAAGCSVSAPASSVSSPVVAGRGRLAGVAPTSVPPPPPLPLPALELLAPECCDDSPDLERLLQAATPQVAPPSSGAQDLRLADLWRWYEVPSTVGCEVATCGGPRGPSTAHYLPYLSSVQLFAAASDGDAAQVAAAAARAAGDAASGRAAAPAPPPQLLSYPDGLDGWPQRMRALVQWGECANMRDRVPLHCRLAELCGGQGEAHPLMATRVADLHPLSWFAVAWYPLYRVPEAPLTARFLTFHTLASLWEAATEAAARQQQQHASLAAAAAAAEAQRQRLQQAAEEAAAAAARAGAQADAGAATPRAAPRPLSRPSYKTMLAAGLPAAEAAQGGAGVGGDSATPTAVCSFPASPTCSDAGTRSTLGSSRPHSVDGASSSSSGSGGGAPRLERSRLACASAGAAPVFACPSSSCGSVADCPSDRTASAAASTAPTTTPASPAASEAGDGGEALVVRVAGLAWYATGRGENWLDTLVAAELPGGVCPAPGTQLADGGRVVGTWRGQAVLARPYPVAKGGPLGWEIEQEEMAQCAERLVAGAGLVALRPGATPGAPWQRLCGLPPASLGICCPDFEFFYSRSSR